jgi:thiamine-phosphate pyrophosphorylase
MNPDRAAILRMIDANLNRAREGIRVVEDCARFVLDDSKLTHACKSIRHQLRTGLEQLDLDSDDLIKSRNTSGDVGTTISTATESDRSSGIRDLVTAASKRATEALRVIEESVKALGHSGLEFESLRYQMYTIEKQVILAIAPPCPQWSLCVLITKSLCTHFDPIEVIQRSASGGASCIQIREKEMTDAQMLEYAGNLTDCAHNLGLHVMINDRAHIAGLVDADGVHLGQSDLPIHAARKLLGHRKWIGLTCPTIDHAIHAIEEGADTCGLGPVFPSTTKAKPALSGIELITTFLDREETKHTPLLAISGINETNITMLTEVGCPGVAVSSSVCSSENPEEVCRTIVETIEHRQGANEPTICP